LLRPIITEKTTVLTGSDKYVFEVDLRANKNQIKEAVQVAFNVRVTEVNTMVMKGKPKRFGRKVTNRPDWKKAIVTLVQGDKIELFEGI
jgi:large subunit ribosomal protein L23